MKSFFKFILTKNHSQKKEINESRRSSTGWFKITTIYYFCKLKSLDNLFWSCYLIFLKKKINFHFISFFFPTFFFWPRPLHLWKIISTLACQCERKKYPCQWRWQSWVFFSPLWLIRRRSDAEEKKVASKAKKESRATPREGSHWAQVLLLHTELWKAAGKADNWGSCAKRLGIFLQKRKREKGD